MYVEPAKKDNKAFINEFHSLSLSRSHSFTSYFFYTFALSDACFANLSILSFVRMCIKITIYVLRRL